tara:strand:+ start:1372 stop:1908 length:537 start_codon:yes stop_codon:yes gene_type:complete
MSKQNKHLNREQYKAVEHAIATTPPAIGYKKNANIIAVLTEQYPELKEVPRLSSLISARRSYMNRKETGKTEQHPLLEKEGTPSAVRPHMDRPVVSRQEIEERHAKERLKTSNKQPLVTSNINIVKGKASKKFKLLKNWTIHSATFTNEKGGTITVQLDGTPTLNNPEFIKVLKNIIS